MNGFQLAGKELKVGIATSDMQLDGSGNPTGGGDLALGGLDEREGPNAGGMIKGTDDRVALMNKLNASAGANNPIGGAMSGGMPSVCICLHGMFNMAQVNLATDPEFFNDIHADVEQECRKYGSVQRVWADQSSQQGDVWVRFSDVNSAGNCQRALDRRWFAGQQIIAEFATEASWAATVR